MDEKVKGNEGGDVRGNDEAHSQPDHPITSVARKAMGSTPRSTVGWGAVVTILGALLYFSSQVDSKIDDRVDKKLDIVKAVYDEKFANMNEKIAENRADINDINNELKSRGDKSRTFDYKGYRKP